MYGAASFSPTVHNERRLTTRGVVVDIYVLAYHSEPGQDLEHASGQFQMVEEAICQGPFPYDNGDDPSFFVQRHGGRLTWGVCRTDVRAAIRVDSIAVFISFTTKPESAIEYRLSAIATVDDKLPHSSAFEDARLKGEPYINAMIHPAIGGWEYGEGDRRREARHSNWLWRLADHQREKSRQFSGHYADVYAGGAIRRGDLTSGRIAFANNYILFCDSKERTYVHKDPPMVAVAIKGQNERWADTPFRSLVRDTMMAACGRQHLRSTGRGYAHPKVHFRLPAGEAANWRAKVIAELQSSAADTQPSGRR